MVETVEYLWMLITIPALLIGSYFDIRDRLIPDKIWLIQLFAGLFTLIWWGSTTNDLGLIVYINIVLGLIFGLVFFMLGAFGGADSKAIIVLAISSPIKFSFTIMAFDGDEIFPSIFFMLTNFMVIFIIFALILLIYNISSRSKFGSLFGETGGSRMQKFNVLFSSYRVSPDKLLTMEHYDPVEKVVDDEWVLHTPLFEAPVDDDTWEKQTKIAREKAIKDSIKTERSYLWIRPQPPGLVFILVAYLFWVFIGSPLFYIFPFLS